jgi:hypothetical protein
MGLLSLNHFDDPLQLSLQLVCTLGSALTGSEIEKKENCPSLGVNTHSHTRINQQYSNGIAGGNVEVLLQGGGIK